jgi:hypothetical protein
MKLSDTRIGYAGYSSDWRAPGDRRRFCAYAAHRRLTFERARLSRNFDVVLVTHNGDIAGWTARKRREPAAFKFIFELVDSYLLRTNRAERLLKALGRFAMGTESRLSPDFLRTLVDACETADAVICSTEEQRDTIRRYNPNVFTSFDYFGDELGPPKSDYSGSSKLRLVWEGQSVNLSSVASIAESINNLKDKVELHIVSDPRVPRFFNRYAAYSAKRALKKIKCEIVFHPWQRDSFSSQITSADVAIIPIDPANAFAWGKPENKLIMMWQLGMPTLASPTPAYTRAVHEAGMVRDVSTHTNLLCGDTFWWWVGLARTMPDRPNNRQRIGETCRAFAERAYSREEFLRRFDAVFEAIGFEV